MDLFDLGGRAFRARLRRELPQWRAEGLVGAGAAADLARRYHLDEEGVSVAAAAIYTLGALLIGGGVISFVAWNWDDLGRAAKLAILFAALLAAHGSGYWMWRIAGRLPKLGHALMLLGTLIFGASIGLVAQIFHIPSTAGTGYGLWAIGAAVAAWALGSVPNGVLGAVLAAIWGCARVSETESLYAVVPYAVAVPFFPLAWRLRSRLLFFITAFASLFVMAYAATSEADEFIAFAAAVSAGALLLLAFSCWAREGTDAAYFARVAHLTGLLALATVLFLCSFGEIAEDASWAKLSDQPWSWIGFAIPAAAGAAALFALGGARALLGRPATLCAVLGALLLVLALVPGDPEGTGAIAANVALAAISIAAVTSAGRTLERAPFWAGSVLGVALILSRFVEFETELWLKAIVFLASGVAVIWFGVVFERRKRVAREAGHA
jgi:uncharacterized membrane protein